MPLTHDICQSLFEPKVMEKLFPAERSNQFFDALLGDADEGAYDIQVVYKALEDHNLQFDMVLSQRPGKCLACNLTYGLPTVFARHPIINVSALVKEIDELLGDRAQCDEWQLGRTREITKERHAIPLSIKLVEIA